MIIDFHTHCFPARLIPKIRERYGGRGWELTTDGTLDGLKAEMVRNGVNASVVLNLATRPGSQEDVNRFARQSVAPEIVPFGSVHPFAERWEAELELLAEAGIRGIKLHPSDQGYNVDDAACRPVYRKISELGFITLFHVDSSELGIADRCRPPALARALESFQGGTVVCAHMGGVLRRDADFRLMEGLPVLFDTSLSSIRRNSSLLRELVDAVGAPRVLFGSDSPWTAQAAEIDAVRRLALTPDDEGAIFHGNAERLLGGDRLS